MDFLDFVKELRETIKSKKSISIEKARDGNLHRLLLTTNRRLKDFVEPFLRVHSFLHSRQEVHFLQVRTVPQNLFDQNLSHEPRSSGYEEGFSFEGVRDSVRKSIDVDSFIFLLIFLLKGAFT